MKIRIPAIIVLALLTSVPAKAWNCPSGQIRVQAPVGTPTSTPFYDVVEGIAFICQPAKPADPVTPSQNQNQTQSQASNNSSNNSASSQNTNKNSNVNTISSTSSSSSNSASNSTSNSASSASNNGNGSNNASFVSNVEAPKIPVSTAIAPETLPTSPCFKTYSGGAQSSAFGISLGGGKVDKGCDDRETARLFAVAGNRVAFAKIMCQTPAAIRAHLTLQDCLQAAPTSHEIVPQAPTPQPVVIVVPSPSPVAAIAPQPPVSTPVLAPVTTLTEIGTFRMNLTPGSGLCPAPRALVTALGKTVLDRALQTPGRIYVSGTARNVTAAFRYIQKNGGSGRVLLKIDDDENQTVSVSVWNDGR